MSKIFGGSKSKSTSENTNNQLITNAYKPLIDQGIGANNNILALLGGDASGFNKYKEATGFNFNLSRGVDGLDSNFAGRNLFRSGARDKAITDFGNNLQNNYAQQYIQSLLGISGQGLGAGQLVSGVGQRSDGSSSQNNGMSKFLGSIIGSAAASDARLKVDITPVGKNVDGLTVYQYRYKGSDEIFTGVMAQEVAEKRPDALGPEMNGYMSVDYSKINILDRS